MIARPQIPPAAIAPAAFTQGRRPALQLFCLFLGVILLAGFAEPPAQPKPLDPVEAAKQGRELVAEILAQTPERELTNPGVLKLRNALGARKELPLLFQIRLTPTNWTAVYQVESGMNSNSMPTAAATLSIRHAAGQKNEYAIGAPAGAAGRLPCPEESFAMTPFAGSDFCLADLGLEFFHWPEQKVLKSELRKTRLCRVLESINPQPATNAYSRVVSWIDDESRGILHAEAYDSQNKLLKEFDTKKFKKVSGDWQLEQMEIYNVQTRSRTQIEFNFDSK